MMAPLHRAYRALPPTARGAVFMLITTLAFTGTQLCIKKVGSEVHPFEIAFFRNLFGVLVVLPPLFHSARVLRTTRFHLHLMRGFLQALAMMLMITAMKLGPLADIVALTYVAPLVASILAVCLLGERAVWYRWLALAIGFAGVLVVLRPGAQGLTLPGILMMGYALAWAATMVSVKLVARTDSSVTIALYMGLTMVPISLVPALFVWTWPEGMSWVWLVLAGLGGGVGHLSLAQAMREADATAVLPFDFLSLIWASGLAYLVFAEVPSVWTLVGGAVIFSAVLFMTWRESQAKPAIP